MEKHLADVAAPNKLTYYQRETQCELLFKRARQLWHLFTTGHLTQILFTDTNDYVVGMNLMGICSDKFPEVKIYTFEIMSNHIHIILSGEKNDCESLFKLYKVRLMRVLKGERIVDYSAFSATLLPINSLMSLRNEIVYVNRNGYLANSSFTPYSYPWGAGCHYFNRLWEMFDYKTLNSLSVRYRRSICHSKETTMSDRIKVLNDIIIPTSYCYICDGERFFRDAHHYFNLLSKNYEAYSEISKKLSDSIFLSDEEIFSVVCAISVKDYAVKQPSLLSSTDKIEIAKKMHFDYNASNKQIQRILKLDVAIIESLFPKI